MADGILYWITGLSGAGKTTIGNRLYYELKKEQKNVVLLDGDILKNIVDGGESGYTDEDRRKRARKYAVLCKTLTDQGITVVCCTIAMYDEIREWNRRENKKYIEVFLDVPKEVLLERDQKGMYSKFSKGELKNVAGIDISVELPKKPDLILKNDGRMTIKECVDKILAIEVDFNNDFDRDTDYWNKYYESKPDIEFPSLFAKFVNENVARGKNILELGCGNGRDSIFFASQGLNVTAIDAAEGMISKLNRENDYGNVCYICDDFVCSPAIFQAQYDYVYSRFSLHAIKENQEAEVIRNVYQSLKESGKFFIEVRSIHDEIYGKGEPVGRNAYIYEGHYRRFIVKEELEKRLQESGFTILISEEKRGFAPFGESDPPIIRIVCQK